jgi:SAM-dependent methyltransferase
VAEVEPRRSICEQFYRESSDPWGFRTRWYERRKRDILVASLPQQKFGSCWELGCSVGELTAALATRCERVFATDGNARAVAEARDRVRDFAHVQVEHQIHPEEWPNEHFDLIVFSELGYNFERSALHNLAERLRAALNSAGMLVACHWRYNIEGCAVNGNEVHELLEQVLAMPRVVQHVEADFLLEIWSADGRSAAQLDGML